MPLLGRHKSNSQRNISSSSSNSGQSQAQQQQTTTMTSSTATSAATTRAPICESPLFGIRRQLPVAVHNITAAGAAQSSQQTNVITSSATSSQQQNKSSLGNNNNNNNSINHHIIDSNEDSTQNTIGNELSSIPKHITRQQIHYAFTLMDTNSDGLINVHDLSHMLSNLGIPIDEAILSHVMSLSSKRGDRRMAEAEFVDWLGNFIQITDSNGGSLSAEVGSPVGSHTKPHLSSSRSTGSGSSRRLVRRLPLGRSATTIGPTALAVASEDTPSAPSTQRRGSGSGLALMRSLSAAASAAAASVSTNAAEAEPEADSSATAIENALEAARVAAEAEARSDLRAAFCVFDLDGDGFITLDEVQAGLELLGEQWSTSELNALFNRCHQTGSSNKDLSQATKKQQQQQQQKPLQRISIEDFVQLLL